jgi:hypothetical protein
MVVTEGRDVVNDDTRSEITLSVNGDQCTESEGWLR